MPITQDRLHRLATAADHFYNRLDHIRRTMKVQAMQIARGQITLDQAYSDLTLAIEFASPEDIRHGIAYNEELTRYNLTHARNAKERLRMIRKRARDKMFTSDIITAINASNPKPQSEPSITRHYSTDDPADGFTIGFDDPPPTPVQSDEDFFNSHFDEIKPLMDSGTSPESAIAQIRAKHSDD